VACTAILEGATFIGTNPDRAFPVETGLWPGAGSIIAAVATATGVTPTIIGKPAPTLLLAALTHLGVAPEHAIMIGDQVATDVRAGKAAGVATVLVEGDLAQGAAETVPDLTVRDLSDLLARLPFP
jgi:4-nitrophenyl phosphatase